MSGSSESGDAIAIELAALPWWCVLRHLGCTHREAPPRDGHAALGLKLCNLVAQPARSGTGQPARNSLGRLVCVGRHAPLLQRCYSLLEVHRCRPAELLVRRRHTKERPTSMRRARKKTGGPARVFNEVV